MKRFHAADMSYFYPRSPCGERRGGSRGPRYRKKHFYPRSPCGERLENHTDGAGNRNFYPRSPCGERQRNHRKHLTLIIDISIHALLAESDNSQGLGQTVQNQISIHALLAESDHDTASNKVWENQISIHALLAESDAVVSCTN